MTTKSKHDKNNKRQIRTKIKKKRRPLPFFLVKKIDRSLCDREETPPNMEHIEPIYVYGSVLYPPSEEGQIRPPPPLFNVDNFSTNRWKEEQDSRPFTPIGTRVLLRRQYHERISDTVFQDTMMIRVDEPCEWKIYQVFYMSSEESPIPIQTKKRKYI